MRHEIKFVGSGGQGVITAAIVLAEAAASSGLNVTQTQSYGPEARGSLCSSETIISSDVISFPRAELPDILVLLTQEACDMYSASGNRSCTILTDSTLSVTDTDARVISLPIFLAAEKSCGNSSCVNMLALGALNKLWRIVPEKKLALAVKKHLPQIFGMTASRACISGARLAESARLNNAPDNDRQQPVSFEYY